MRSAYNARYYDPVVGRFTQPDTIVPRYQDPRSLNRYSYVVNNPTGRIDPTGNCDTQALLNGCGGRGGQDLPDQQRWCLRSGFACPPDNGQPPRRPATAGSAGPNPCGRFRHVESAQCSFFPDGKPGGDGEGLWYGSAYDSNRNCVDFFGVNGGIARGSTCTTFGTTPDGAAGCSSSLAADPSCADPLTTNGSVKSDGVRPDGPPGCPAFIEQAASFFGLYDLGQSIGSLDGGGTAHNLFNVVVVAVNTGISVGSTAFAGGATLVDAECTRNAG